MSGDMVRILNERYGMVSEIAFADLITEFRSTKYAKSPYWPHAGFTTWLLVKDYSVQDKGDLAELLKEVTRLHNEDWEAHKKEVLAKKKEKTVRITLLTPEEIANRKTVAAHKLDLTEQKELLSNMEPGQGAEIYLEDGETTRTIKRRFTVAAKELGLKIRYLAGSEDRVILRLDGTATA